jgi:predicted dehydrogenase
LTLENWVKYIITEQIFLQDWTISADLPQGGEGLWRMDVDSAGSGVTGDLLAHCIDTAMWLNGAITDVSAVTELSLKSVCIS